MQKFVEIFYQIHPGQPLSSEMVEWYEGITVIDALKLTHAYFNVPKFSERQVGVFGKILKSTDVLKYGDRIEVYAPLRIDPKEARRLRSFKKKN